MIKFHPHADIFPLMEGAAFDALVADIKANGLQQEIVLHEGMILDGRNRYRACLAAGCEETTILGRFHARDLCPEVDGDPAAYVLSANIHRRHLTAEQKRELIAKLLKVQPEKSDRQVAKTVKASPTTVGAVRAEMEAKSEVSKLDTRTDAKGVKQPAKKRWSPERRRHHHTKKSEKVLAKAVMYIGDDIEQALHGLTLENQHDLLRELRRIINGFEKELEAHPDAFGGAS